MNGLEALSYANQVRKTRSVLKRELAAKETTLADVLEGWDPQLRTMRVGDLLRAVPAIGSRKTERILHRLHIAPSTTLEHFPAQRRMQLLSFIAAEHKAVKVR